MKTRTCKYLLKYEKRTWWIQRKDNLQTITHQEKDNIEVLNKAFKAFCKAYFPNVLKDKKVPWDNKNEDSPDKNKWWPLGWYWQSLFPVIKDFKTKNPMEAIIYLSQVRNFFLLSLVKENKNGELELIAPPIFGCAERLTRGDQYQLYREFFAKEIIEEVKNARKEEKSDYDYGEDSLAYVLGRHDVKYTINAFKKNNNQIELELIPEIYLHPFKEIEEILGKKVEKHYPYDIIKIPSYNESKRKGSHKKPLRILVSSNNICSTLCKISEVWNDRTARSVLLIAPPGSGKELIAEAIYKGGCYSGKFITTTMASGSIDRFEKTLFTVSDKTLPQINERLEKIKPQADDGFVLQALNGVLFLDEVDKSQDSYRAMLLRLLETSGFTAPNTPLIVNLKKTGSPPLYIFAGSLRKEDLLDLKPLDFWTRISHMIEIRHPLDITSDIERKRCYRDYFVLFWNDQVISYFKDTLLKFPLQEKNDLMNSENSNNTVYFYYIDLLSFILKPKVIKQASEAFIRQIYSNEGRPPSIRNIRSIVSRIVFKITELILFDKDNKWRTEVTQQLQEAEKESDVLQYLETRIEKGGFNQIFDEMVREAVRGVVL